MPVSPAFASSLDKERVLASLNGRFIEFYAQFSPLKKLGGEMRGPCPLHGGDGLNFTVDPDTGHWYCHSQGCGKPGGDVFDFVMLKEGLGFPQALEAIAAFTGTQASFAGGTRASPKPSSGKVVATYDYTDEEDNLLYQVQRWEPGKDGKSKSFTQRRPDGRGGWINSLGDVRRVLYHLSAVTEAVTAGKPVYTCEGEGATNALRSLGVTATCNSGGAGNWRPEIGEALCGTGVIVIPDNDEAGERHAQKVAVALHGTAKRVRIVRLPGLPLKGDAVEWIAAGGTLPQLLELVRQTPDWTPGQSGEQEAKEAAESFPLPSEPEWPDASPLMFHGLAGDIVRAIEPHTEADPVALLIQTLAAFGSCAGRRAHFVAEADQHFPNLFAVLVGVSAKGRKGTSWSHVRRLFAAADPAWGLSCIQSGLSSGEGLIWHVRDPIEKQVKNKKTGDMETVIEDAGIDDKRLLVQESEFASVLRVAGRDGNTLSAILRDAWDRGKLQTMTKNSAARATGAHISLIGHVTADELRRELSTTEAGNGFANRFLWVCVRRSKELPEGGDLQESELYPLRRRLEAAIASARLRDCLRRDDDARGLWRAVYHDLSEGGPGLSGAVTSRGEAQTMRLALLYALLDESDTIRPEHLTAALALWEYVEASARYIFGDSLGDSVADDILRALRANPAGLSRNDIRELFARHQSSARLGQALALLARHNRARAVAETDTGGRPAERWYAVRASDESAIN